MSQQTVMAALLPFYARFMGRFPQVEDLAAAPEADVLAAWAGLGYYSRARNLHRAARMVVAAGGFPRTVEGLLELPGVGPYTAAAMASQCFGVAVPVWDGNVLRVMSRLSGRSDVFTAGFKAEMLERLGAVLAVGRDSSKKRNAMVKSAIQHREPSDLRNAANAVDPSAFNQGLMELGATVCTPRSPVCGRCPLSAGCVALRKGLQGELPPPKPRKAFVDVSARVFVARRVVARRGEQYLLVQRSAGQWFAGLWDFPSELGGVKEPVRRVAPLRMSAKATFRPGGGGGMASECPPKRHSEGRAGAPVACHTITHHKIRLTPVLVDAADAKTLIASTEARWFTIDEMLGGDLALATTAKKVLRAFKHCL